MNQTEFARMRKKIFDTISVNRGKKIIKCNKLEKMTSEKEKKLEAFEDIKITDKSEMERNILLEQYNLALLNLQIEINNCEDLNQRAIALLNYIVVLSTGGNLEEAETKLSDAIYKELMHYYDYKINLLRQKRLIYKRQIKYLDYLKDNYKEEYKIKVNGALSSNEIANDSVLQYDLEEEKKLATSIISGNNGIIKLEKVKNGVFFETNIVGIAKLVYPEFKDKLLEDNEESSKGVK